MRLVRLLLFAVLVLVATALLGRYVVRGPADSDGLAVALARETRSADQMFDEQRCRRTDRVGAYRCEVADSEGSGSAIYRVRVRPGSSCWDARRVRDLSGGDMPRRAEGCVYLWQWSLGGLLADGANFAEEHL
jgi:hypothetical protein